MPHPNRDRAAPPTATSIATRFQAGLAAQRQGRVAEAEHLLQAVLEQSPRHFGALCSLASLRLAAGAPAEGLPLIDRALREQPHSAEAQHARACLLQAAGRVREAEEAYRLALAQKPDFADASSNFGALLTAQRRYGEAVPLYEAALRLRPDFAAGHNNLGVALLALGRTGEALEHFSRAASLQPRFADAHGNRGSALVALGRLDEARAAFSAAIALAPNQGRFHLDLARCTRLAADDSRFLAMQRQSEAPAGLDPQSRIELEFALGKACDDQGRHAAAFAHLAKGNALKRARTRYDEAPTLAMIDRIATVFSPELMRAHVRHGEVAALPVFVLGMPRSGTTLVEQILASHPAVFGAGERPDLQQAAIAAAGPLERPGLLFDALAALEPAGWTGLGAAYAAAMRALAPDAARVVDKMPGNFLHVGLIALAMPGARVIHVSRDPLDTCFSCFATLFSGQQPYAYDLGELGRYYRHYAGLMAHWQNVVPEATLLQVRYEDVVDDIEREARRMVAHCGLPWDARCLRFHDTSRAVQTASKVQVRQPLYRSAVGRSQAYRPMLRPLLEALD